MTVEIFGMYFSYSGVSNYKPRCGGLGNPPGEGGIKGGRYYKDNR